MPTPSKSKAAHAAASLSSAMQVDQDCVDVTRDNIEEQLPVIERALKECSFYAFDNE